MVGFFTGNRAGVLLLLPFIVALYHFMNQLSGGHYQPQVANMGFWGSEVFFNPLISEISAAMIILLNAIGINIIFNSNEFYERNSYISSLLYVVFMSFYHSFYSVDGLLIAHTALILLIHQIFRLRQNEDGRAAVFNASVFGGLASTFHPPMIAMFPFVLVMIWNIRPFIIRELFLALSGFAIPMVYANTYFWYTGQKLKWDILQQVSEFYKEQTDFYVTSGLFVFLIILSSISIRNKTQKSSIRFKKLVNILWLLMAIGLLYGMIDLVFFDQIERFSFLMVPLAFFLSFSFMDKKISAPASALFYLTFVYSLINFFF
ncbi:MAG: hypothetical protein RIT43_1956 [Bacteroidota bacterium]|jgi:hypothetical protein